MDMTSYPSPTFIGLRRKERRAAAGWCNTLQTEHVVEICSVSNCIAGAPDIWLDGFGERIHWTTEKSIDAWTSTNAARQSELQSCSIDFLPEEQLCLYAFRAFPWMFARAAPPVLLEPRQLFAAGYAFLSMSLSGRIMNGLAMTWSNSSRSGCWTWMAKVELRAA